MADSCVTVDGINFQGDTGSRARAQGPIFGPIFRPTFGPYLDPYLGPHLGPYLGPISAHIWARARVIRKITCGGEDKGRKYNPKSMPLDIVLRGQPLR